LHSSLLLPPHSNGGRQHSHGRGYGAPQRYAAPAQRSYGASSYRAPAKRSYGAPAKRNTYGITTSDVTGGRRNGYGNQFGYDHGKDVEVDHADYSEEYEHEIISDDDEEKDYAQSDDEDEFGFEDYKLGLGEAGQHRYQNQLLDFGEAGDDINAQVSSSKRSADNDTYGDHAVERDAVGYSRRQAHAYGPEFGDHDGDNYGQRDNGYGVRSYGNRGYDQRNGDRYGRQGRSYGVVDRYAGYNGGYENQGYGNSRGYNGQRGGYSNDNQRSFSGYGGNKRNGYGQW